MRYFVILLLIMTTAGFIFWAMQPDGHVVETPSTAQGSEGSALSDTAIRDIIDEQRLTRTDLPQAYAEYDWVVREQANHYTYIEYGLPKSPGFNQIFTLNKRGIIVDVQFEEDPSKSITCPEKTFSESELAGIVARARATRDDLPAAFSDYRTRVDRMRCLYMYFEYALPEVPGKHHVFVIDPFGELMEVFPSSPYPR